MALIPSPTQRDADRNKHVHHRPAEADDKSDADEAIEKKSPTVEYDENYSDDNEYDDEEEEAYSEDDAHEHDSSRSNGESLTHSDTTESGHVRRDAKKCLGQSTGVTSQTTTMVNRLASRSKPKASTEKELQSQDVVTSTHDGTSERPGSASSSMSSSSMPVMPAGLNRAEQLRWKRKMRDMKRKREGKIVPTRKLTVILNNEIHEGTANERKHVPVPPMSTEQSEKARRHRTHNLSERNKAHKNVLPSLESPKRANKKTDDIRSPSSALPTLPKSARPKKPLDEAKTVVALARQELRQRQMMLQTTSAAMEAHKKEIKRETNIEKFMYADALALRAFCATAPLLSEAGKQTVMSNFASIDAELDDQSLEACGRRDGLKSTTLKKKDREVVLKALRQRRAEIRLKEKRAREADRVNMREQKALERSLREKQKSDRDRTRQVLRLQKLFGAQGAQQLRQKPSKSSKNSKPSKSSRRVARAVPRRPEHVPRPAGLPTGRRPRPRPRRLSTKLPTVGSSRKHIAVMLPVKPSPRRVQLVKGT